MKAAEGGRWGEGNEATLRLIRKGGKEGRDLGNDMQGENAIYAAAVGRGGGGGERRKETRVPRIQI